MAEKFVYDFEEGNKDMKYLLGGKGANLAEMTNMGLPVPHGFTVTCEACNAYRAAGRSFPDGMLDEVATHLRDLEEKMGRRLGEPTDPLLVSVRSGAPFSMPGMMDTVLNVGLNDESVEGLAKQTGSDRFAWDSYRRLLQMFGKTVMGVDGDEFENALDHAKEERGVSNDVDLDEGDLRRLVGEFKRIIADATGRDFPQDPQEQLKLGIEAVFGSWDNKRAVDYRRKNKIDDSLGTAVNVQSMVFGNKGDDSGTGVAFTRNPANGDPSPYGDYLPNAQGEDVVAGIRNTLELEQMAEVQPSAWEELQGHMRTLEQRYRDMCDIEFTVEQGKLWLLQTRVGKRTAFAEWVMAYDMLDEDLIDVDMAVLRLDANRLEELFKKVIASEEASEPIASGLNASPGAAVGKAVFTADDAQAWAERGEPVILVRRETTPDDYHGMIRSEGILTSAGGTNSHAAVVARGEGIPAVCGADAIRVDRQGKRFKVGGTTVAEGDWITIDGFTGKVYEGQLDLADSPIERARAGDAEARKEKIWRAYERFMVRADEARRLRVRANADTPSQSANAVERGAEGIGLCRTEHMFLGEERVAAVRTMIFATTSEEEHSAYDTLLPLQRDDFVGIFREMDGKPVTVRLLDPPLHEFLPNQVDLAVAVAVAKAKDAGEAEVEGDAMPLAEAEELLAKVDDLHEANPMLGLRGVRLGIVKPGLYAMQVRAIVEAACQVKADGGDPRVEIMIPLAATREELAQLREELEPAAAEVLEARGQDLEILWGTMIELPRAAVTAGEIAEVAEFFSFGTNDLTQTAFGFSRDDIGKFLGLYEERKLLPANPFVTIDRPGVGRLMQIACEDGRAARSDLHLGICGEHGGDPDSVRFCHELGLDYVSCSPFRVPTARLAAGQAALGEALSDSK
ncbi:MAG TPA: pyruvate, phosphate dikinase [Actinomycetota bacterium]|jgi:pyruvate, orthophosphate dikinase|nr:pyruvate, phosphate dikinase [Actinomycetota bacterium]